jgi:predicted transcriptional regulator
MKELNNLFQNLGISKVRLAKYLGVSRQMVYNYLELDDINKWPKEKKLLLFKLLKVENENDISSIEVSTEYIMDVENRLHQGVKSSSDQESYLDLKGLDKNAQKLIPDIVDLLKDRLKDEEKGKENLEAFTYMYHMLQSMENVPEIKYVFGYFSKTMGFTNVDEYAFDDDKQYIFEGILYTALTLYNNGGASRAKLKESHKRWEKEIEVKKEEQQSRTQQLNTVKFQALAELGYTEINASNAEEVFEKMAEIESRKV